MHATLAACRAPASSPLTACSKKDASMDMDKRQLAVQLYQEKKIAVKHICAMMGISKPTLYAYVRQAQSSS